MRSFDTFRTMLENPSMAEFTEELMEEIQRRLSAIEASLPREMHILAVSPRSKLPFKALSYRETLI